jgi:hypothetical protein
MYGENLSTEVKELVRKVNILLETLKVTPGEESEWVTKEVAMKMLYCSERTLQTLRDNNSLPYSRPTQGSKFLYRKKDIIRLIESGYTGNLKNDS